MKTPSFNLAIQKISRRLRAFALSALAIGAALALLPQAARAANVGWDGGPDGSGTSWNDAVNWAGDVLPGATDKVFFANAGTGSSTGATLGSGKVISLDANQTIYSFNINNSSNPQSFVVGSASDNSSGYVLTLTNVFRGKDNSNVQTIAANVKLASDSLWNIVTGYNGFVGVTGNIGSASAVTFTKEGTNTLVLNGANTFTGNLRVLGGTLTLGGTNAYTGTTTASGGTLTLNFGAGAAATPLTNIVSSSSALVLGGIRGGGTVTASGKAGSTVSQTFNGATLNSGGSSFTIANGNTANTRTSVNLGAITRNAGSTVDFVQPTGTGNTTVGATNGYTTSTSNDATGILGAYATVGGTDWASNNGTNIVAYTGYTVLAGATPNIIDASTNVRISSSSTGNVGQAAGTVTINTLNANDATARTVTVGSGNTLRLGAVGGVLSTGTGGLTIGASGNAGTLTAGGADNTAGELILNNSTALTVNSVVANNGSGAVSLVKSGAGTATLAATNTYTGGTTVNAGTLAVTAGSTNPLETTGAIRINGGTLNLGASTTQTTSGAVVIAGGTLSNGTLTNNTVNYDARGGAVNTKLAGSVGLDKTTSGTLTFTNTSANTYSGTTTISEGNVVGSTTDVISIAGDLVVGTANGSGSGASYSNTSGNRNFNSGKNLTVYSNGSVNFGSAAQNLSGTVQILGGSLYGGQLYQNVTINMTGGTASGTWHGSTSNFTILASADTATVSATLNATNNKTWNVADGAAAVDMLFSGNISTTQASSFTKAGAGLLEFRGTSVATGATTVSGGTLRVTNLANGGVASAVGQSTSASANLKLNNGTTLEYAGTGHSTDRLFTINGAADGDSATLAASGTGAVNFTNTGALAYNTNNQTRTLILAGTSTADNTLAAAIGNNGSGAVSVTKNDAGKWILTGANTYTGTTTVNAGTLILNGSSASGMTIASTGTLSGTGTISGATTIAGTHSPGNSPGIQTFGSDLTYSGGASVVNWELKTNTTTNAANPSALFDTIIVNGNLNFAGATALNLSFLPSGSDVLWGNSFWNTSKTGTNGWLVYDVAGTTTNFANLTLNTANWQDSGSNAFNTALPGASFSLFKDGNDIYLNYTAVPEPATWGLLAFSLTTVLVLRRRRRS